MPKRGDARCSFCGKRQDQVRRLVAGPGVFICDLCIALSNQIMNEEPPTSPTEPGNAWTGSSPLAGR